jgi:Tfp pilus assembly protein PilO
MERVQEYRIPILAAVAVAVLAVIVYLAWISPEGSKLTSLHSKETELQAQQTSLQIELGTLKHEKQNMNLTCAQLTSDINEIPGAPDVDSFLQQVTTLAVASGDPNTPSITVTEATGSTKGTAGVTPVAVDFTLTGTYGQMSEFLKGLYSFPRFFTITSTTMSGGPIATGGGGPAASTPDYSLNLSGDIFYSPDQQDVCSTPK